MSSNFYNIPGKGLIHSEYRPKTNLDRIKEMDAEQLVRFLRLCDFTRIYPVIEGETFYNEEDVIAWLHEEAK